MVAGFPRQPGVGGAGVEAVAPSATRTTIASFQANGTLLPLGADTTLHVIETRFADEDPVLLASCQHSELHPILGFTCLA
jgi:hypothetical protein